LEPECDSFFANIFQEKKFSEIRKIFRQSTQPLGATLPQTALSNDASIGVFDSGVGGLTVVRALRRCLPRERFVYLGDTARLPYGTKSKESVVRYSLQAAGNLARHDIKCLVVACNTASALALDELRAALAPLPVVGVIEAGAEAGVSASRSGRIAVIATESTVRQGAYQRAITARRPDAITISQACPLFVSLAEEGWISGPIVAAIAHRYLDHAFAGLPNPERPDTLVLGCTHFPVLTDALREVIGADVTIVDSAQTTAVLLEQQLRKAGLLSRSATGSLRLLATDSRERFARVGAVFLGETIGADDVQLVDLSEQAPDIKQT
jgi:glutamate racemase